MSPETETIKLPSVQPISSTFLVEIPYTNDMGQEKKITSEVKVSEKSACITRAQDAINAELGIERIHAIKKLFEVAETLLVGFREDLKADPTA